MAADTGDSTRKPACPWREIAEEASHEYDPRRMAELMRELNQAMQEQDFSKPARQPADEKSECQSFS
jgi:hypothetical protein